MILAVLTPALNALTVAAGWVLLIFVGALALVVISAMFTGKIDLARLISEPNGDASMSRFQFLVFTFVIAVSLFLIVAYSQTFPTVPQGVLVLLGISGSSYLVSKGIQFSSPEGVEDRPAAVLITPQSATSAVGGDPIQFQAEVIALSDQSVTWEIHPPTGLGAIDANGKYTPPAALPDGKSAPVIVNVAARSRANPALKDIAGITL